MPLKTLGKISAAVKERPTQIEEAKKKGKKVVGWLSYNVPEEILHALGLISVRLGLGGDEALVEKGGRYLSTQNCVFLRETVGLFEENKDPYIKNSDLVVFDCTCLQTFRTAEVVKYYFGVNTLILDVPKNFYLPEGQEYFRKEVADFTGKLEEFSGTTLDFSKLAESVKLFDHIREAIKKLYDYQASAKAVISWHEVYTVVQANYYLDKGLYLSLLKELLAELKAAQGDPTIHDLGDQVRIFISGSVIPPGDTKLIEILEKSGARIVGDDIWSGLAPSIDVTIKEPTLSGIADGYINRLPHAALPYLDAKTDQRLATRNRLVQRFKAHGVIYHTLRYCDPFTFKAAEAKKVLNNEGLSVLEIHTEYAGSDYEGIRTRVGAFVELLDTRLALAEAA
jgi:benzoyl-CoA reductase/2-hydroxyglutaryl-CoA dehydratase subunit BcrC/BadD/HgdB